MTQPQPAPISSGGENEDRLARMRGQLDQPRPEPWKGYGPGDELAGEVLRYERGVTKRGDTKTIAILRTNTGQEIAVWLLHGVLESEFLERQRPAVGEFVLIRYNGLQEPKGDGAQFHHYSVVVDRQETTPWDDPAPAEASQPAAATAPDAHPSAGLHQPLEQHQPTEPSPDDEIPF